MTIFLDKRKYFRTAGVAAAIAVSAVVGGVAGGQASAAPYTGLSGCTQLYVKTGSTGWEASAGVGTPCANYQFGTAHIQITGPGVNYNGRNSTSHPLAVARGNGRGTICATLWQHKPNNVYVNRGRPCVTI